MFASEDRSPKLLPVAVSLGLHAAVAGLVVAYAARPTPSPPMPAGITVTLDALSTSIAPGAELPPAAAPASTPAPALVPEAQQASPDFETKADAPAEVAQIPAGDLTTPPPPPAPAAPPSEASPSLPAQPAAEASLPAAAEAVTTPDQAPTASTVQAADTQVAAAASQDGPALTAAPDAPAEATSMPSVAQSLTETLPSTPATGPAPAATVADSQAADPVAARDPANALPMPLPETVPSRTTDAAPASAVTGATSAVASSGPAMAGGAALSPDELGEAGPGRDPSPSLQVPDTAASAEAPAVVAAPVAPDQALAGGGTMPAAVAPSSFAAAPAEAPIPTAPSATLDTESAPSTTPAAPPPAQVAKLETGPSIAAMDAFVTSYNGGPCFFASVTHASGNGAAVDVLAADRSKFQALNDAFAVKFGIDPDVLGQRVAPAQCPAVELIKKSPSGEVRLRIDRTKLIGGDTLTGTAETVADRTTSLYIVTESGHVDDVTRYAQADHGLTRFAIPIDRVGKGGPLPRLLIAVSSRGERLAPPLVLDGRLDASGLSMAGKLVVVGERQAN